ncbi:MAG: Crp/Fnr family transcriptional regulator [Saprospiraceae bacterium]|nr:Crp/Fnr family transcriptional regulator [Saprospiraceae bacterium]
MYQALKDTIQRIVHVPEEEWSLALPKFQYRTFRKGEYLLSEGQVCKHIDFIVAGCVRIFFLHDGKELSRQFFFENGFVTELGSLVAQKPSLYYLEALEPLQLLSIRHDDLEQLYSQSNHFLRFGKIMAEQIAIFVSYRNVELVASPARERYLRLLNERPKVMSRVPLHMIASYLGITPEALSRLRKEISIQGG